MSVMFCWESFIGDGRFSIGAELVMPMHTTGGSCDITLK